MATLFAIAAYMVGLFGTLILIPGIPCYLVIAAIRRRRTSFLRAVAMLCGYLGGATLAWELVPSKWTLPLSTTFAASVDAAKYGHPTEHYAECILVAMALAAVVGAISAGGFAVLLSRRGHLHAGTAA
jgi:hypothetical protein